MNQVSPRLLSLGCIILFVFMYAPLLVVIVFSLTPTEYGVRWEGFTLKWYQAVFDNKNIQAALKVSLMVAIPCVLISTAIGTITAFTLYRSRFVGRSLYQGILYIPLIMPDLVIGISLLLFYTFIKLELGVFSILLAHVSFISLFKLC